MLEIDGTPASTRIEHAKRGIKLIGNTHCFRPPSLILFPTLLLTETLA